MTYYTDPNNSHSPYPDFRYVDPFKGALPDPWFNILKSKDAFQLEIEYFFPLTEQIPLDLDCTGCDTRVSTTSYTLSEGTTGFSWGTTAITNIAPQLTITPNNPVGELSIGGINVGIENKPSWLQRRLYKLLGFNWKDK